MWTALFSAFWLGILTAISPCPLATNIAAVSFIGSGGEEKKHVISSGLLYSIGRSAAYVILGIIISFGIAGSAEISRFLQKHISQFLGPILILLGLVLLGWIGSGFSIQIGAEKLQKKAKKNGFLWAAPLGFLFALSFCPVSAALFFSALIPLVLNQESFLMLPFLYGIGTSLPVVIFAFLIARSSAYVGKLFNQISRVENWIRNTAGAVFIVVGIYYCLTHIYGVSL